MAGARLVNAGVGSGLVLAAFAAATAVRTGSDVSAAFVLGAGSACCFVYRDTCWRVRASCGRSLSHLGFGRVGPGGSLAGCRTLDRRTILLPGGPGRGGAADRGAGE